MVFKTPEPADAAVTPPEAALCTAVHYGLTVSPPHLPAIAAREWYSKIRVTQEECRPALAACLVKGWLQGIDERAPTRITEELHQGRFIGPIYGLPPIGGVDFTCAGAAIRVLDAATWQQRRQRLEKLGGPP